MADDNLLKVIVDLAATSTATAVAENTFVSPPVSQFCQPNIFV